MKPSTFAITQALLVSGVVGQDVWKSFNIYSDSECGNDPNNLDGQAISFDLFENHGVITDDGTDPEERENNCARTQFRSGDWPNNAQGDKLAWMDSNQIDDGCELIFYREAEPFDDLNNSACHRYYRRVSNGRGCTSLALSDVFGVSYCCGDGCRILEDRKRSEQPPKTKKPIRDVAAPKRAPLVARQDLNAPDPECEFEMDGDIISTWGEQRRVSSERDCPSTGSSDCTRSLSYSVAVMESETWGAGSSVGVNVFGIVNVQASFNYDHTEAETNTFTATEGVTMDPGTRGYWTFTPRLECVDGEFHGGCDWDTESRGRGCFTRMHGSGEPDGLLDFVQTN